MKIHLGKTATSRSRKKKVTEEVSKAAGNIPDEFTRYLLNRNFSNATIASYVCEANRFKAWLRKEGIEKENVYYNDLTAYLQSLGNILQGTKMCYMISIKHYFNFLIEQGDRIDNPADFIQLKGLKRMTLHDILNRQELDQLYGDYKFPEEGGKNGNQNWFKTKVLAQKRNKVILGMILFQGLDTRDLKSLTINDVKLQAGKVFIAGTRRSNERQLPLKSSQLFELMEYLATTRNELIQERGQSSDHLFVSIGQSDRFGNMMVYLLKSLKGINTKVVSLRQLRVSVIVHWLKEYNLREVQYMAGHRYISSTESFLANEMDDMIEEIERYHPVG